MHRRKKGSYQLSAEIENQKTQFFPDSLPPATKAASHQSSAVSEKRHKHGSCLQFLKWTPHDRPVVAWGVFPR